MFITMIFFTETLPEMSSNGPHPQNKIFNFPENCIKGYEIKFTSPKLLQNMTKKEINLYFVFSVFRG